MGYTSRRPDGGPEGVWGCGAVAPAPREGSSHGSSAPAATTIGCVTSWPLGGAQKGSGDDAAKHQAVAECGGAARRQKASRSR